MGGDFRFSKDELQSTYMWELQWDVVPYYNSPEYFCRLRMNEAYQQLVDVNFNLYQL